MARHDAAARTHGTEGERQRPERAGKARFARPPRRRRACASEGTTPEDGNMLILGLGAWMVVVALLFVLSAASALYVERRDLLAEADSMALALADELDAEAYYSGAGFAGADTPALSARAASLARPGTSVVAAARTATGTVEVRLRREVPVPLVSALAGQAAVALNARAQAELRPRGRSS